MTGLVRSVGNGADEQAAAHRMAGSKRLPSPNAQSRPAPTVADPAETKAPPHGVIRELWTSGPAAWGWPTRRRPEPTRYRPCASSAATAQTTPSRTGRPKRVAK